MSFRGVDLTTAQLFPASSVGGAQSVDLTDAVNARAGALFNVDTDEIYQSLIGLKRDFDLSSVWGTCDVVKYYQPVMVQDTPLLFVGPIDVTQNLVLDRAISASTEVVYIFLNGYLCWEGAANGVIFTPATTSVPAEVRQSGYLMLGVPVGTVTPVVIDVDRVYATGQLVGGGTESKWLTMPDGVEIDDEEILVWDKYGACYSDVVFSRATFLRCFLAELPEEFNSGAVVNELYRSRGWGQQEAASLNFQNATGYDLTYLGQKWFGVIKRAGETEANYKDRIVATVVGEKCTVYAIKTALGVFSPFVNVLEGVGSYAYVGASFIGSPLNIPAPSPGPAYTDVVRPCFIGSILEGLLHVRVQIQSNAVTTDPVNGRFIYELLQSILMAGVTFDLQLI